MDPKEIAEQLTGTDIGNTLEADQIGCHSLNAAAILRWCGDLRRKGSAGQMLARWALLHFCLVLSDPEPFDREIDHLASLRQPCGMHGDVVLAASATLNPVDDDLIGSFDLMQGVSRVA